MSRKRDTVIATAGILAGLMIGSQATAALTATPSNQHFYLRDKLIGVEAYTINGSNYVKLRDIGQAIGFSVSYDPATNSVVIDPDRPYTPQTGDVVHCDDGTDYAIIDVSRYDKNYFASGPVGDLPEPTCDWSQFDQPEMPEAEARHFTVEGVEYLFVRSLYETRRMLYTLYNAMGENPSTWQSGQAVRRSDGTPWIHIQLTMPEGESVPGFWPWNPEVIREALEACPCGDWYLEVWDVYADGIFQRTEYKIF